MLPTQGQGASQSVEDAEALGAFFDDVEQSPSMEQLEGIFEVNTHQRYIPRNIIY
jgi:salicylate hydroxylase